MKHTLGVAGGRGRKDIPVSKQTKKSGSLKQARLLAKRLGELPFPEK